MKKLFFCLIAFCLLSGGNIMSQTVKFTVVVTSATTFDMYFTVNSTFTSASGGISSFGVTLQTPGPTPSGTCAPNLSAPAFTITPYYGLTFLGASTAAGTDATNTASGTTWWNQLYSFTNGTAGGGVTFVGGTAYKIATFTLPALVNMNCVSLMDFPNNKIPGQSGLPRGGTSINIAGNPVFYAEDNVAMFNNPDATNATVMPTATNGGSAAGLSTMPLAWNSFLPVTFISFTGIAKDCAANLKWTTGTEINSNYYSVEYSTDGNSFSQVGKVASKNNATGSAYSFVFKNLAAGNNYFRLKAVDFDGTFSYASEVLTIKNSCSGGIKIYVWPNPAKDNVTVYGLSGKNTLTVTNAIGQKMTTLTNTTFSQPLSISTYASGTYIISILNQDGSIQNVKFVKK